MPIKSTNKITWQESRSRWRIAVQKDGIRKEFYSSDPTKKGKAEVREKADKWLAGEERVNLTVQQAFEKYIQEKKEYAPKCNWRMEQSHYDNWMKRL